MSDRNPEAAVTASAAPPPERHPAPFPAVSATAVPPVRQPQFR